MCRPFCVLLTNATSSTPTTNPTSHPTHSPPTQQPHVGSQIFSVADHNRYPTLSTAPSPTAADLGMPEGVGASIKIPFAARISTTAPPTTATATTTTTIATTVRPMMSPIPRYRAQIYAHNNSLSRHPPPSPGLGPGPDKNRNRYVSPTALLWVISLLLLGTVISAKDPPLNPNNTPAQLSPADIVPFDPLVPLSEQLTIPVAAGVPPLSATVPELQRQKEHVYIRRLEIERVQRRGSFYVELTPTDIQMMKPGMAPQNLIRYSKEPLPWEGMPENEEGGGLSQEEEDYTALEYPYSPWGDEFQYRARTNKDKGGEEKKRVNEDGVQVIAAGRPSKKKGQHHRNDPLRKPNKQRGYTKQEEEESWVAQMDMDDGATDVVDRDLIRIKITPADPAPFKESSKNRVSRASSSLSQTGRTLKAEEVGEFGVQATDLDPNVGENISEVVDPAVWDAEGGPQRGPVGTQEYMENTDDGGPSSSLPDTTERMKVNAENWKEDMWSRPDEIDLLGHEAEVDWLDEQDRVQQWARKERKKMEYRRPQHGAEDDTGSRSKDEADENAYSGEGGVGRGKEMGTNVFGQTKDHHRMQSESPEEIFHDLEWEMKHGMDNEHFHYGQRAIHVYR
ncbi:hypothetical protein BC939DRAFT_275133 [Gamsiella multidivaricata]|uniref:uncharacterized protein n=1 Tax=Gamsiella multidivaricata TaxID=101098 RepID=UPI00221EAE5E|nr:uncharacterized protein BC939DRAFT_275133 [Gamsiella multidivaricata]KAI7818963.1 hypothetical protein BC939DRAFT_275133 [Gamsiella multidivaricata]